ncbi:MAG TPA: hypothetical protein VGF93_06360 [Solirubrobacteraceae bacterium]|jgi:hypothetical protein
MTLLKRAREPKLSQDDTRLLIRVYGELYENVPACRRLIERHAAGAPASELAPEALARARGIAYTCRYTGVLMGHPTEPLLDGIPEALWPISALAALTRLAYAFAALAEQEVVPEALLTLDEIDGLIARYELGEWIDAVRGAIDWTVKHEGSTVEFDLRIDSKLLPAPDVEGGLTPLRRVLLANELPSDGDAADAPGGLRPEAFSLMTRYWAIVTLLANRGELYTRLLERYRDQGPSPEIDAVAVESAVDIAAVMQSIRRERELLSAARETALDPGVANKILDDLFYSFVLLTSRDEDEALALLDEDWLETRATEARFAEWLGFMQFEPTFVIDADAAVRELRNAGESDDHVLDRLLEWMRAGRVTSADVD